jgi:ribosome maturation protein SDO1
LEKGELQISDKERENQAEILFKDIANIISEKCCHPENKRPFSVDSIKSAMKEIHFSVKLDQPAKKQASECIKKLRENFFIDRAEMRLKLTVPLSYREKYNQNSRLKIELRRN